MKLFITTFLISSFFSIAYPGDSFDQLFYNKYKTGTSKGTTKVMGWSTNITNIKKLKKKCKDQYRGFTACFFYKKKENLVHISSGNSFKALVRAAKTNYFMRVDISVDGSIVDVHSKN